VKNALFPEKLRDFITWPCCGGTSFDSTPDPRWDSSIMTLLTLPMGSEGNNPHPKLVYRPRKVPKGNQFWPALLISSPIPDLR